MNRKLIIASGLALGVLLSGCSSNKGMEESMASLNTKVDQLADQVSALRSEQATMSSDVRASTAAANEAKMAADEALAEAMRANQRLDNMASSYTK